MTPPTRMPVPAPRGYAVWATSYDAENVVTTLDQLAANQLTPPLDGTRLLDAGCGTGRRLRPLRSGSPRRAVGVDIVHDMLRAGPWPAGHTARAVNGDISALPFAPRSFDVGWCRLALGHVADINTVYREIHRVLVDGGVLVVTDFHPAAAAAGHVRTFKDQSNGTRRLAFHAHALDSHIGAATRAGLEMVDRCERGVGPEVRSFYETADRLARYEADRGLPLLFGFAFRRAATR